MHPNIYLMDSDMRRYPRLIVDCTFNKLYGWVSDLFLEEDVFPWDTAGMTLLQWCWNSARKAWRSLSTYTLDWSDTEMILVISDAIQQVGKVTNGPNDW